MYQINETKVKTEDNEEALSYGITYKDIIIEDVSVEKEKIEKLVHLCNELELDPIHIHDVVDDFLVNFEI